MNDLFNLEGKTALVSGCKRGIGFAMAEALAEAGANIIGVSATLESEGSKIEKRVKEMGREFKGYSCDFSDRKALYVFIKKVKEENKHVDILVNNAGTILRQPAAEHSDEYWDKVIEVNQNAQFILSREFGKEMLKKGVERSFLPLHCSLSKVGLPYQVTLPQRARLANLPWHCPMNGRLRAYR